MLKPLPIKFHEDIHRYQWMPTGEWLAHSVTGIKGAALDESKRKALAATKHNWEPRGLAVHKALELFLTNSAVKHYQDYIDWIEPLLNQAFWQKVDVAAVEYRLCDLPNSIGGSCDCLLRDKSTGKYLLCDLKTQGTSRASTYSTDCQMGGYLSMFQSHHPSIVISECLTIWSRPGTAFITHAEPDVCLAAWQSCLMDFQLNYEEIF